jgi:hypothetical protein
MYTITYANPDEVATLPAAGSGENIVADNFTIDDGAATFTEGLNRVILTIADGYCASVMRVS